MSSIKLLISKFKQIELSNTAAFVVGAGTTRHDTTRPSARMRTRKGIFLCVILCSMITTMVLISAKRLLSVTNVRQTMKSCSSSSSVHIHAGETERLKRATDALPWLSHHLLPRVITRDERDRCIELLSTVDAIFREFNITYMLAHGTLLGSYVMHDMLPWDDDLDIFVNLDDLPKIKRLFNASGVGHYKQIQLLETENESSLTAKVFSLKDPNAGVYRWHWPYIDIAFYTDKNMVMSSHQATPRWELNRGYFFPTVQRPLGGRWFPTPRNTSAFIAYKYKHFVCKSHTWNHKKEVFTNRLYSVNCITLASHYPFVERKVLLGKTTETLTLNCTARYSLTLQE